MANLLGGTVTVLWHMNMIMQCTGTLVGPKLVLTAAAGRKNPVAEQAKKG